MKNILLVAILLFSLVATPAFVFADIVTNPQSSGTSAPLPLEDPFDCDPPTSGTPPCFIQILQRIMGRVLDIVYPILAGIVFYGGFQMMFARGEPEKYKSGLKTIKYAVIGFVVILFSQGIAFILVDLVSLGRTP